MFKTRLGVESETDLGRGDLNRDGGARQEACGAGQEACGASMESLGVHGPQRALNTGRNTHTRCQSSLGMDVLTESVNTHVLTQYVHRLTESAKPDC